MSHEPELVERVVSQLRALYDKHAGYGRRSTYHCEPVLAAQAAWVLALAERAAREQALSDGFERDDEGAQEAVRRAVEGT